jgi:hypothetical protein
MLVKKIPNLLFVAHSCSFGGREDCITIFFRSRHIATGMQANAASFDKMCPYSPQFELYPGLTHEESDYYIQSASGPTEHGRQGRAGGRFLAEAGLAR